MERLACVDFPEFPLQLLIAKHPQWKGLPAAVVAQDKPQSEILWVSPEARAAGVLPGMRYAQGLSLATDLRAAEVSAKEVQEEVGELADILRRFSPEVEVSEEEPGVFWVNADGLLGLFLSLDLWAQKIHSALTGTGRRASVVVGFRRFAVYAIARGREGVLVLAAPGEEEMALRRVPLSVLTIDPNLRDMLAKLGVHTIGDFLALPVAAIRRRFGDQAVRLHALALGDAHDPLSPVFPLEPAICTIILDAPEGNSVRLLFIIQEHLHPLLAKLAKRGEALRELEIHFYLERPGEALKRCRMSDVGCRVGQSQGDDSLISLRPAEATLDETLILDLLRLRLEGNPLPASAREIRITAHGTPASRQQIRLFLKEPRRDLAAANRALARIRAELGEEVVVRAKLIEGHLPEACFTWEPLSRLSRARPESEGKSGLVRRLYSRPAPLGMRLQQAPDGQLIRDLHCGQVVRSWGPYMLSGGWWRNPGEHGIHRRYYFLETPDGKVLWVFYDGQRQRWFLQGQVE